MTRPRIFIGIFFLVSAAALFAGQAIDVASASRKPISVPAGRRCIIRGDGFGAAMRIRIFLGSPERLMRAGDGIRSGCVELDSLVGEIAPHSAKIDLDFHPTYSWLKTVNGQYKNTDYSFVLERIPSIPRYSEFRPGTLRIQIADVENYFAEAIHVTVEVPSPSKARVRKSRSGQVHHGHLQRPPSPRPRPSDKTDCERVTFKQKVNIQSRNEPRPATVVVAGH